MIFTVVLCGIVSQSIFIQTLEDVLMTFKPFTPYTMIIDGVIVDGEYCDGLLPPSNMLIIKDTDGVAWTDITSFDGELLYWHMYIGSMKFKTSMTLRVLLLHEFGHVYGLEHPADDIDSIMGYSAIMIDDQYIMDEIETMELTWHDVDQLMVMSRRHARKHGQSSFDYHQWREMMINLPFTLTEQRTLCRY